MGDDPYHQPGQWGQNSAFLRLRGSGDAFNHSERRSSQAKSRLGRGVYNRHSEENKDDDQDVLRDGNTHGHGQSPGVKFYLSSNQRARGQDRYLNRHEDGSGSESGGHDDQSPNEEDQRQRSKMQPISDLTFTSDLGGSFVSEIGRSSSRSGSGSRRERVQEHEQDDMADSVENERESQKKGVFGLLNQIYEMNNVTK